MIGVDAVREGEIDDPVNATERDRRLGTVAGQRLQTRSSAPGQYDGQYITIHQTDLRSILRQGRRTYWHRDAFTIVRGKRRQANGFAHRTEHTAVF